MANIKEIEEISELLKSPVKNIKYEEQSTIIEFENGQIVPLHGGVMEIDLNIPTCNFCGNISDNNDPLFTTDDKTFICKKCVMLAVNTFLKNGIQIDLEVGEFFPEITEQLKNMTKNVEKPTEKDSKLIENLNQK